MAVHVATLGLVVYQLFGPVAAGWVLALRVCSQAAASPLLGRLADKGSAVGVLKALEVGIVFGNVALALALTVGESLPVVLVLTAAVGAAMGGEAPALSKYAISQTRPSKRSAVLGLQGVTADIANTAAPLLAALAIMWFPPAGFVVSAAAATLVWLQLKTPKKQDTSAGSTPVPEPSRWKPNRAWCSIAISTAAICLFTAQIPMLPLAMADGSAAGYAGAAALFALGTGVGAIAALPWKEVGPSHIAGTAALAGCAWMAGAAATGWLGTSPLITAASALLAGTACGAQYTSSSTALLEAIAAEHQGQARGAYLAVTWMAYAVGAVSLGVIAETSRSAVPWIAGASALLMAIVATAMWPTRAPIRPEQPHLAQALP